MSQGVPITLDPIHIIANIVKPMALMNANRTSLLGYGNFLTEIICIYIYVCVCVCVCVCMDTS